MLNETMPRATPRHTNGPPESPYNKNPFDISMTFLDSADTLLSKTTFLGIKPRTTLKIKQPNLEIVVLSYPWQKYWSKPTWHAPLLVLKPPAQKTLSGSFTFTFSHIVWQTVKLTVDTSVTRRSFTTFCFSVLPHPATMHFVFGFTGLSLLRILTVFTPLLSFSFLESLTLTTEKCVRSMKLKLNYSFR